MANNRKQTKSRRIQEIVLADGTSKFIRHDRLASAKNRVQKTILQYQQDHEWMHKQAAEMAAAKKENQPDNNETKPNNT